MTKNIEFTDDFDPCSAEFKRVFYHSGKQALYIRFNNDTVSGYGNVSQDMYEAFFTSISKGSYYNRVIQGSANLTYITGGQPANFVKVNLIEPDELEGQGPSRYRVTTIVDANSWDHAALLVSGKVVRVELDV